MLPGKFMRELSECVVVITGASSGIGRATAERFAREGASTVLVARDEVVLEEVAARCRELGGNVLVIPADVSSEIAVQTTVIRALDAFGRIDVWFNNAGVGVYGPMEQIPSDVYRQVIETNLFGYIHGARSILPVFKRQGEGILINNASIAGKFGLPFASAYAASKFAIVGLSQSLREELQLEPRIHVCTLMPAAVDTPFFQHAGNYSGKKLNPPGTVHDPEEVADKVIDLVHHPRPEVSVGGTPKTKAVLHEIFPRLMEIIIGRVARRSQFKDESAAVREGLVKHTVSESKSIRGGFAKSRKEGWRLPSMAAGITSAAGIAYFAWRRSKAA